MNARTAASKKLFPYVHPSGARRAHVVRHGLAMAILGFGTFAPGLAVDGVIEINQAKASAGSVTPGDNPGFPVQISQAGSYRLTSDLTVAAGFDGLMVTTDNVTIDLNGFSVVGGGGAISDGIVLGNSKNVEIRDGTVRGFSRHGVFSAGFSQLIRVIGVRAVANSTTGIEIQGVGSLVDECTAVGNLAQGIRVVEGSLVINSIAHGNTGLGLGIGATSGYRSNVFTGNNGGDANPQTTGTGVQIGTNICGTRSTCP